MFETTSPRERLLATIDGRPTDRPPVSFWGHAYHRESTAEDLADATLEFWSRYEWDFVKLNPRASYHAETWGVEMRYSGVPNEKPKRVHHPIRRIEDWAAIGAKTAGAPPLTEQIDAIRRVRASLPKDVPLIETVFSPLAIAADLAESPATVVAHLRADERAVLRAVGAIAETFRAFVPEVLRAGAEGIYFATVDFATRDLLTKQEYGRWARPYDLSVIAAAAGAPFNVLHVCRRNNHLLDLADYPVTIFSWAVTEPGNPGLADGLRTLRGALAGGIGQDDELQAPTAERVLRQLEDGWTQTGGRRWIVAPGCSIPPATPHDNLRAIRDWVVSRRPESTVKTRAES
jgi:uroporphyrinogen decarboxylase